MSLESALDLARRGFRVFPLRPRQKLPAIDKWPERATANQEKALNLFIETAQRLNVDPDQLNIGIATGRGVVVIDLDIKENNNGLATWEDWDVCDDGADTYRVRTPSGGLHLYFGTAQSYRNSVRRIGAGVDVRGEGGFVVAAGSELDAGSYRLDSSRDLRLLPDWTASKLGDSDGVRPTAPSQEPSSAPVLSTDIPADLSRAIAWLKQHEPAVEGSGGDHHTFKTFAKLKDLGIAQATAVELAEEHWNGRNSPPWPHDDLIVKARNAYRYGENPQGTDSPAAAFDPIPTPEPAKLLQPLYPFNALAIPPRPWVFGKLAIAGKVTMLVAPPGAGKSSFTLAMALSKATGRPLLGIDPLGQGKVAVWNNEDDYEELQRRLAAVMHHFNIEQKDLLDENSRSPWIHLNSGEQREFRIAKRGGSTMQRADLDAVASELRESGIRLFVVDPLSETHPGNENDNGEMRAVVAMYRRLAQLAGCAVLLVAHSRKPDKADSTSHAGDMNSLRGASSQAGVARAMFTFYSMAKKEAKQYGLSEAQAYRYARLDDAKANLSLSNGEPLWFERVSVTLPGSNESVGVLAPANIRKEGVSAEPQTERDRALLSDMETLLRQADGRLGSAAMVLALQELPMNAGEPEAVLAERIKRAVGEGERYATRGYIARVGRVFTWREADIFD